MKISVVISTYNGEKYIEEELESVRLQTKQPDEVLIFDDISSDRTFEVCEDLINKNRLNGWKVIQNKENKGWRRNFMEGIAESTGDLIFISDQDDEWAKNKIEIMTKVMERDKNILLLTSDFVRFTTPNPEIKEISDCTDVKVIDPRKRFLAMGQPGCTYCIKRELFDDAFKIWLPDFAHDAILWRVAAVKNGIRKINNDLHYWRIHQDSTFAVLTKETRNRKDRRDSLDLLTNYLIAVKDIKDKKDGWEEILDANLVWLEKRKKLYDKRSIKTAISLIKDISRYRDMRQYMIDLYLALGR